MFSRTCVIVFLIMMATGADVFANPMMKDVMKPEDKDTNEGAVPVHPFIKYLAKPAINQKDTNEPCFVSEIAYHTCSMERKTFSKVTNKAVSLQFCYATGYDNGLVCNN